MSGLKGRAVVITGSGRGLGAAYARAAAALGARIVINDLDNGAARAVAAEIQKEGGEAVVEPGDIATPSGAEAVIERCLAEYGEISGLVNNAGIFIPKPFVQATLHDLRAMLEVNVVGVFNCTKAAWGHMIRQQRGSIVNVTSGAQTGQVGRSLYGGTKGAVASFTYGWAAELEGTGVRVNAISPVAATPMSHGIPDLPPPESNAPVVLYLLSDRSSGMTGQVIRFDGRKLSLMSHPANRAPVLERDDWSFSSVAEVFESRLAGNQLPIDLATYEISRID